MQLIPDNSELACFRMVIMQPPKPRIQKSRKRPFCSSHLRRFNPIPLRIPLNPIELRGMLFLVRLERLVTLLKFVAAEASWATPQKPWVSSDLFMSTSMLMSWFNLFIAVIEVGGEPDEIYVLPVSYLKVYLKDHQIPEPSLLFTPPAALRSPAKKFDRDMFFPTANAIDCPYPASSSIRLCNRRYQLRERGMPRFDREYSLALIRKIVNLSAQEILRREAERGT